MIREIRIENYKSIHKLKLELGRVNVLIGENGSGKTNILEAIALSAAAASEKLDNEFLAPRGIRITAAERMQADFDNVTQEIKISLAGDDELGFKCVLQNDNTPYAKWINKESQFIDTQVLASAIDGNLAISLNSLRKMVSEQIEQLHLDEFLIYSPESRFLRRFEENGPIQPLGIHGEGLFKLLKVLSLKNQTKLDEIKEKLRLIGWFRDFDIPQYLLFSGEKTLPIKDKYVDKELGYIDQTFVSEGFLFLLFYFTLFISDETPPFFAIENLDASLNPRLCRLLIIELVNLAEKYEKQVIFTTHQPAILDGLNLNDDEQRLFVVSRSKLRGYSRARRFLKPKTPEGEEPVKMSEAFLRGYIGGLTKGF
jgi:AAA15 family ATPase/GTPase